MMFTRRVLVATLASAPAARRSTEHTCKVIDSAVHVWSNGQPPYPWAVAPPEELTTTATYEALTASAQAAGVAGALIVQPANHNFDHSYVTAALRAHPDLYRGMCLANPTLEPEAAVAELARLHAEGFVGVRFNPYLFRDGMDSPVGHALYKKAGELKMPVGVMCFQGLLPQLPAITALLDASPATTLIVDHFGFFRQPSTGGLHGAAAANDEAAWKGLLLLAARAQVHVKVSAFFRASAEPPPHNDLQQRLQQLLSIYGATRLLWGSDFPFVLHGGKPSREAQAAREACFGNEDHGPAYAQAAGMVAAWQLPGLDEDAMAQLMGGTAQRLFGF